MAVDERAQPGERSAGRVAPAGLVGELHLRSEVVTFPGDPDQTMIVFMAEPGSPTQHALDLLEMS